MRPLRIFSALVIVALRQSQEQGLTNWGRREPQTSNTTQAIERAVCDGRRSVQVSAKSRSLASLRKQEAGCPTADFRSQHGLSETIFYKWKSEYGGLNLLDAKRLKALKDENAKRKKLLAETMLDNAILKDINNRKR
jgi:putative transposase